MRGKRLPLVIRFNTDSYFNPIAQYDWTCIGALLMGMHSKFFVMFVGQYDTITSLSFMEINMLFCVCVCVKNWANFCSEYLKEQGLLGRTTPSREYNIKMDP